MQVGILEQTEKGVELVMEAILKITWILGTCIAFSLLVGAAVADHDYGIAAGAAIFGIMLAIYTNPE